MASDTVNIDARELELRARELDLKEAELRVRSEELANNKNNKARWYTSPLTLAGIGTVSGLFATALSLYLQALSNNALEQKKMEYSLIQNALADGNKKQALRNLKFLDEAGLVSQVSLNRIATLSRNSEKAPSFAGAVIRDEVISVADAKRMLKKAGVYNGAADDVDDSRFRNAIAVFQMKKGRLPDGLLGPCTLRDLWSATGEVSSVSATVKDPCT